MVTWLIIFGIIALIAAVLGFVVLAELAATIFQILFFVFLVLLLASLLFGRRIWRR